MASDPVDFRKGHDGLAALVQSQLRQKPFDGSVYVFRAKRADRLKLIYWDGSGLVPDAADFADDLLSTFKPDHGDIYRNAYNVLVKPDGVTVEVHPHSFPIPWQHIASVVDQLNA